MNEWELCELHQVSKSFLIGALLSVCVHVFIYKLHTGTTAITDYGNCTMSIEKMRK